MVDTNCLAGLPWTFFLAEQRLPPSYADSAERWFTPLVDGIVACHAAKGGPIVVAINGSQGSGKSTLGALLDYALPSVAGLSVATVSLDDFYLTRAEREQLAATVHPLLRTRGVPGTHDLALMTTTLNRLVTQSGSVLIPRFDKAQDDRTEPERWHHVGAPVDVLVWEGWCLGVRPESEDALSQPLNDLEAEDDPQGEWRRYANDALADYQGLFDRVDLWAMLAAPSFDCVFRWRCEQEEKLAHIAAADSRSALMSVTDIQRFIQFYQRLTSQSLATVPPRANYLYQLDEERTIQSMTHPAGSLA